MGNATVVAVRPQVVDAQLQIMATVRHDDGALEDARMPEREVAAILPRSLLISGRDAPSGLLETIQAIAARFVVGRQVRLWEYAGSRYFAFQTWRNVRFSDGDRADAAAPAAGSRAAAPAADGPRADGGGAQNADLTSS